MALPLIFAAANLALGVGTAWAGHNAQKQAARASERAAKEQKRLTTNAAYRSAAVENEMLDLRLEEQALAFDQQIGAIAARRGEERTAANRSILSADRALRMADGTARLSAGAAGVAGASVDAVLSDLDVQGAGARKAINDNFDATARQLDRQRVAASDTFRFTQRQTEAERKVIIANRDNRIAGVQNIQTTPRPNPLAAGMQIAGAMIDFGSREYARRNPT
jgi:hypothetical protein